MQGLCQFPAPAGELNCKIIACKPLRRVTEFRHGSREEISARLGTPSYRQNDTECLLTPNRSGGNVMSSADPAGREQELAAITGQVPPRDPSTGDGLNLRELVHESPEQRVDAIEMMGEETAAG